MVGIDVFPNYLTASENITQATFGVTLQGTPKSSVDFSFVIPNFNPLIPEILFKERGTGWYSGIKQKIIFTDGGTDINHGGGSEPVTITDNEFLTITDGFTDINHGGGSEDDDDEDLNFASITNPNLNNIPVRFDFNVDGRADITNFNSSPGDLIQLSENFSDYDLFPTPVTHFPNGLAGTGITNEIISFVENVTSMSLSNLNQSSFV